MTKEESLAQCRNFDVNNASLSLWVFKKKVGVELDFTVRSVLITDALKNELKQIITATRERYTEVEEYSLLMQTTEVGVLALEHNGMPFERLKLLVDRPAEEYVITNPKQLENSAGYVIRLRSGENVMYCIKKTSDNWKTKKASNALNVILRANQLDLVEDKAFSIAKSFDFLVAGEHILVANKAAFESLLNYKLMYANSFTVLQQDATFGGLFSDMQPLIQHVGTNTMHLRRMEVIRRKGFYANADYIQRLRQVNAQRGWNIEFDEQGRIVPTEATIRTILQVLLNHRLFSELSLTHFDVPSATQV